MKNIKHNIWSGSDDSFLAMLTNPTELARAKNKLKDAYPLLTKDGRHIYADVDCAYFDLPKGDAIKNMTELIRLKFLSNNIGYCLTDACRVAMLRDENNYDSLSDFFGDMCHVVVGNRFWESPSDKCPDAQDGFIKSLSLAFEDTQDFDYFHVVPSRSVIILHLPTNPKHPINRAKGIKWLGLDKVLASKILKVVDNATGNKKIKFIFGDNYLRLGNGGQAVIRDLDSAYGIPTKKMPNNDRPAFITDDDFDEYVRILNPIVDRLKDSGYSIVFPNTGIGTGRAIDMYGRSQRKIRDYLVIKLLYLGIPEKYIGNPFSTEP